jgi:hypothetical protein
MLRLLAAMTIAVTSLASIAAGPAAAATPPTEAGCPGGHQAWVHIAGSLSWQQFVEIYAGGGSPTTTTQATGSFSGLRLNLDFCTTSYIYAAEEVGSTNIGLNSAFQPTGASGKHGYSLRLDEVGSSFAYVNPTVCDAQGSLWNTLAVIASLPLPGKYAISVGAWLAQGFFGSQPGASGRCRGLGDVRIPISVNSSTGATVIGVTGVSDTEVDGPYQGRPECTSRQWQCTVKERFTFTFTNA